MRRFKTMDAVRISFSWAVALAVLVAVATNPQTSTGTEIRDICRVKGQEESVIRGMGLVVGLNGTGEAGDGPTMRALARSLQLMGSPLGEHEVPTPDEIDQLRRVKNVALVMVTATIPATGARSGDRLDCQVAAMGGKSLEGGRLVFAALKGPNTQDDRVFGLAEGPVAIEDPAAPLTGRIHNGCQVVQDVFTPFQLDGHVTLVLDRHHADFVTATAIAEQIRSSPNISPELVQAVNAANIVIRIPESYENDPVAFVAEILEIDLYEKEPEARVTISERSGSIVISGDVEIGVVVVTHKDITVDTNPPAATSAFLALDTEQVASPRLANLVDTLNQLKVPTADIIEIIKGIERSGKLHGKLIIE